MVEKLENDVAGLKTITLRAYLGKTQGKLTVRPVMSKSTGQLLGVKRLTDDEKRFQIKVVDAHSERTIEDGITFNIEDSVDAIDWEWVKHCPEIEGDLDDCHQSKIALFYVENVNKDTDVRIKKRRVKIQAFLYLQESSQTKKVEILRLMGIDASSYSNRELEDYLGEIADSNPKKLVDAFEDKLIKVKLFMYGLLDKRIVEIDQDGVFRWGAYILGTTEKSALEWLQISDNAGHVKRLQDILYPAPLVSFKNEGELALPKKGLSPELLDEEKAKERYKELFGKMPHHMVKHETVLEKIKDEEDRLTLEEINQEI